MKTRIPKTIQQKLADLDDHLFILREHYHRLGEGLANLKVLAAELRVLICYSSGTEGLLWRLMDGLKVSDSIPLHVAGGVDTDHPLAKGLYLAYVPIERAGYGPAELPPAYYSLKSVIKETLAVFVAGTSLTHEYLIKAIAQQMGSAHEDDGIEPSVAELSRFFVNGVQPYVPILAKDAEFTLEIGERVLEIAEQQLGFSRKPRGSNYGDLSIAFRFGLRERLSDRIPLFKFQFFISAAEILIFAKTDKIVVQLLKRGKLVKEIKGRYLGNWQLSEDIVFVFSYCSRAKQIHAIINDIAQDSGIPCDLGWLHANEMLIEQPSGEYAQLVYRQFVFLYSRLLSSKDAKSLLEMSPQPDGNWHFSDDTPLFVTQEELESDGVFPE